MLYELFLTLFVAIPLGYIALKFYAKATTKWCKSQTCLVGKTAIVTASETGIGYEIALDFAKRGARVILVCRDEAPAEEARGKIVEKTNNENVVIKLIDMASFDSVRAFAKGINETEDRLDILVNNYGAGLIGDVRTNDGHVVVTQINYFSGFLLTHLLTGLMKKTKQSRIVNVSSEAAEKIRNHDVLDMDTLPELWEVYKHCELCNILFTIELAHKLEGTGVTTYSHHSGDVKTEIFRHSKGTIKWCIEALKTFFLKTSEEGAQTTIYCAVAKGIEKYNGGHFNECRRVEPYKMASVPDLPKKLWELTQDIVQLKLEEIVFL